MKTFLRITVAVYVLAGIVLALAPEGVLPTFYKQNVMSALAFASAALIMLPAWIFRSKEPAKQLSLLRLQTVIAAGLLINGAGGLGLYKLYKVGFQYDKLAHFLTALLFTVGLTRFYENWFGKSFKKSLIAAVLLTFFGGILWEFFEFASDRFLGTELLGGGTGLIWEDTTLDVVMNTFGIAIGAVYLFRERRAVSELAEGERFELSRGFRPRRFSRPRR